MDKMTERLAAINARRAEINAGLKDATQEQMDAFEEEVRGLNTEALELRKKALTSATSEGVEIHIPSPEERTKAPSEDEDFYDSVEYRQSFRKYMRTHNKADLKQRADAQTVVADLIAVVPTTVMNMVVEQMTDFGEIFSAVHITNFKGGVEVPLGGAKPAAAWITEGSTAEKKKYEIKTKLTFSYFKLQVKVASSLLANVVSLDLWEKQVSKLIAEAMVVAIEAAVISGTGIGQPTGIVGDARIPAAQVGIFAPADATWQKWKSKMISLMPLAYRKKKGAKIYVNPLTWDKYMDGMVDSNGQPIARTIYGVNGEETHRFMGKPVVLTELLPDLDASVTANVGDVFLIYGNLSDYGFNTNMQITQRSYMDEDTDEYVEKSTMVADGKIVDPFGFVLLKTVIV